MFTYGIKSIVVKMDKEKETTLMTYGIIIILTLFIVYFMTARKTINFTSREFCILKGVAEMNKTIEQVTGWDSSCFHPFDNKLPLFECRIKCYFR